MKERCASRDLCFRYIKGRHSLPGPAFTNDLSDQLTTLVMAYQAGTEQVRTFTARRVRAVTKAALLLKERLAMRDVGTSSGFFLAYDVSSRLCFLIVLRLRNR